MCSQMMSLTKLVRASITFKGFFPCKNLMVVNAFVKEAKIVKRETQWMFLCIAGGRSAPPKNEVAGIAGYISNVSFR